MAVSVTASRAVIELGGPVIPGRFMCRIYWDGRYQSMNQCWFKVVTMPAMLAQHH